MIIPEGEAILLLSAENPSNFVCEACFNIEGKAPVVEGYS